MKIYEFVAVDNEHNSVTAESQTLSILTFKASVNKLL